MEDWEKIYLSKGMDSRKATDPKTKAIMMRVEREEIEENEDIPNVEETDPDIKLLRKIGEAEWRVQKIIALKIFLIKEVRKNEKFKRYMLADASPAYRKRLLEHFRMPPDEVPQGLLYVS